MDSSSVFEDLCEKGSGYRDGIYYSKQPYVPIPKDPFLDWTTHTMNHEHMDWVALVDAPSGESVTYRELKHRVYSLASGLADIGVKQGHVVMILSPNSIHFPALTLAVTSLGAVFTPLNPASTTSEIVKNVTESNTSFLIAVPELLGRLANLKLPLILIDYSAQDSLPTKVDITPVAYLSELYKADPSRAPNVRIRQTDTAVLLFSSGTTGLSKGVKISHGNAIAASCIGVDPISDANVQLIVLVPIPMFHVMGLILMTSTQLRKGSKLVIMPNYEFHKFLEAIQRYKVTNISLVPILLTNLVKYPLLEQYDLSSLQTIGVGAAPTAKELLSAAADRFKNVSIRQGFGMTETTGVGARTPQLHLLNSSLNLGAVGILAAHLQAKIVDLESGKPLPPNCRGELWLRGPTIMQGYLNNEKATAEALDKEGWLHTGDIACFNDEGYLYIVDRLKELIKYNGFQVPPAELEAILFSHPQILDAAVAGFPDERTGQIPVAFIVRPKGCSLTEDDVKNFVAEQVAPYKKVRKVFFVETIPKSPSGKILRRELVLLPTSRM